MKTRLKAGLSKENAELLVNSRNSGKMFLERLKKVLEDKIEESYSNSIKVSNYANPSWAYLQADHRGYERALQEVISLISE